MARDPLKPPRSGPSTPSDFPVQPPAQQYSSGDFTYTVEVVGTINNALGKLTEAVQTLKEQRKDDAKKIDDISHAIYGAKVGLWIIGVIVAAAGSACGFILKMIFDAIVAMNQHH